MNRLADIILYLSNHGPCRVRDLEVAGFRRQDLRHLLKARRVERLTRGVYQAIGTPVPEYPGYAELFLRSPNGVLCLLSALQFHGITTQLPHKVWFALEKKARAPRMQYPPLTVVRFSGEAFSRGIEVHERDGISIRVYSVAKTVADAFKMRNKVGLDVAMEALREALSTRKATRTGILEMAKICRMEKVMRPYLEMEAVT
jgi:predicted transcriptional regulator of viral defense system